MPNDNCLEGVSCPECGSEGPFWIHGGAFFLVHDACGKAGTVEEFKR
jgi:hypothetical protein